MKLSVHQPYFLPYGGYIKKVILSDVHVMSTAVKFTKNDDYTCRVPLDGGWLGLSVTHKAGLIKDVKIMPGEIEKVMKALTLKFGKKYPHAARIRRLIAFMGLCREIDSLSEFNYEVLLHLLHELGRKVAVVVDSEVRTEETVKARIEARAAQYAKGPFTYLSGGSTALLLQGTDMPMERVTWSGGGDSFLTVLATVEDPVDYLLSH